MDNILKIALWFAAREGQLDIVRKLVQLGEDVNQKTPKLELTPLILVEILLFFSLAGHNKSALFSHKIFIGE